MAWKRDNFVRIILAKDWRREAGDTLIEVTLALSILSMVLTSSTVITAQAFRMGQTARERTAVSDEAQGQMEAVRAFRDNNTWDHFLKGEASGTPFNGIMNASTGTACKVVTHCFHMEDKGVQTFLPVNGTMAGAEPTSYIEISETGPTAAQPNLVNVTINYGFERLGGGQNTGHISTSFANVQYTAVPPLPPPAPFVPSAPSAPSSSAPTPAALPTYLNCDQASDEVYFMDLWDYPKSNKGDWHLNYTQPGRIPHPNSTISFQQYIPAGKYEYWAVAKDAAGANGQGLHYLFYAETNPVVGVQTPIGQTVDTPDIPTSGKQAAIIGTIVLNADVRSIMAQHATKIASPDDGVDSACLAMRPINP